MKEKLNYYFFLQKIQFLIVARFLLYIVPVITFLNSDAFSYYFNPVIEKYSIPVFILYCFGFFVPFVLYVHSIIYVFRNISFKEYAIYRTGKRSNDIGFATIYSILIGIVCLPLLLIISFDLYKIFSVYFIQIAALYFLFKRKICNYSVEKRDQPLHS